MPKIFITGDVHMDCDFKKIERFNERFGSDLTKEDILIILGDVGLVWGESSPLAAELYCRERLNQMPWTTLCVLGNHENYNQIKKLPTVKFMGQRVKQVESSIFYLNTATVYNLYGADFLIMNGADSVDKDLRTPNVDWWKEERISNFEMLKAIYLTKKNNVDFLLSHTGGTDVCSYLGFKSTISDKRLDMVKKNVNCPHYCGHYHSDVVVDERTAVLFDSFELIYEK